jgi:hypothetical protein
MFRQVVGPGILRPGRVRLGWDGVEGVVAVVVVVVVIAVEEAGCSCVRDLGIVELEDGE